MEPNLKQTTLDNLTKAQSVMIVASETSGTSGLAAALALYLACQKLGKSTSIVAKSPTVGEAQKLYGVGNIGKTQGSQNLVVIVKNAVETVDRVSHYLDGDQLKLILHAFPGTSGPQQQDVTFSQEILESDVIFAIGFESEEALKQYITHVQNISPNSWLININTRDTGQIFAQVNVFDENASGLGEIAAQLISDLALPVDEDIAFNLYQGISQDTNNFNAGSIGSRTFEIASWLVKFGAGHASFAGGKKHAQQQYIPQMPAPEDFPQAVNFQSQDPFQTMNFPSPSSMQQPMPPAQPIQNPAQTAPQSGSDILETPLQQVEREKHVAGDADDDWLNPPKIYHGSKSFDTKE